MRQVPPSVRAAWGLVGEVERLDGGQGTSVRVGPIVLKPQPDEVLVAWQAQLCHRISATGFRLPPPVPARDGRLVVDGWSATAHVGGEPVPEDDPSASSWLPVLAASRAFHTALADEPRPPFLDRRDDRWARADRIAWHEADPDSVGPRSRELIAGMGGLVDDEGLPRQMVHGVLSGNVLLADPTPPAIIDISPYWRPAAYADAVVVVDALLWWSTDPALAQLSRPTTVSSVQWRSLLTRALVFRLFAFDEPRRDVLDINDQLPRYAAVLGHLRSDVMR